MKRPTPIKTIGILGGMSDKATAHYYRMINEAVNKKLGNWEIAETIIQGLNFGNIEYFVRNKKWDEAKDYLINKAVATEKGGADLLLCVSNTMHKVLEDISYFIKIPFLHIADPTGEAIVRAGLSKVALIGTKPVMEADYLKKRYKAKFDIDILVPNEEDQIEVDRVIFDELVKGKLLEDSKIKYIQICNKLKSNGAEAVILGCTEIFLLIKQEDLPELPLFNTTELHVNTAVKMALS